MARADLTIKYKFDFSNAEKILGLIQDIAYLQGRLKIRGRGTDTVGSVCNDIADDLMDIIEKFDYEQIRKELEEVIEKLKESNEDKIEITE